MTKQVFIQYFERCLLELSCPKGKLRRKGEELSDHHDFLKRTALKEGLSDPDAEAQASQQLGDPVALAEEAAAEVRERSWWGRHPIIGFILLPLATLGPAFLLTIFFIIVAVYSQMTQPQIDGLFSGNEARASLREFKGLFQMLFAIHYVVLTLFTLPFTWMARRSASGMKWVLIPCLIFAAQGMFLQLILPLGNRFPIQYDLTPNLLGGIGPLLIAVGEWWRQSRLIDRLPPLPAHLQRKPRGFAAMMEILQKPIGSALADATPQQRKVAKEHWFKKAVRTPTYWVMVIIVMVVLPLGIIASAKAGKTRAAIRAKNGDVSTTVWPGERDAVMAQLQTRQATKETAGETTIDLSPYINVQLSESVDGKKGLKDNHLLALPSGTHIYGGVPFDVQGRIQLMGRGLEQWARIYPVTSKEIKIGRKFTKIHLFEGENCSWGQDVRNVAVAKLILHYTDGSEQEIQIKSGVNMLDWWGVIYTTQADKARRFTSAPDSELAWVGLNPWIKKSQPQMNLRLYKSTFENPQPTLEVESVNYASTMTYAAPFLLGLTVE